MSNVFQFFTQFWILITLIIQVLIYSITLLVIQPQMQESHWIGSFAVLICITFIAFQYYTTSMSKNSALYIIIELIFKITLSSTIFMLPNYTNTYIIKSAFFTRLLSTTKIKKPSDGCNSNKNKSELMFALFLPIALSVQQSFSYDSIENQLIIILLCVDVILKILLYIMYLEKFFISSKINDRSQPPNMIKNHVIDKKVQTFKDKSISIEDKMQNEIQYSSSRIILAENIFLVDHSQAQRAEVQESQNINVLNQYQIQPQKDSPSIFTELLNYFSDGMCIFNKRKEMLLHSKSMLEITGSNDKFEATLALMKLRNCQEEIINYQNKTKFYDAAIRKVSKLDLGDVACESPALFVSSKLLAESRTVGDAVNQIITKFNELTSDVLLRNSHRYDVDMFCTQSMVSISLDVEQKRELKSEKLYKVSIRPFAFQGDFYIFVQVRDATHQNEIQQLQTLNENKSKMMEQVTHEFRTPLNCIILLVQDLMESSDPVTITEYLEPVLISAQSLLSLIQDLLDLAQLKAGKFQLIIQEFDLIKLCQDLKTLLSPSLALKGNVLEIIQENLIPKTITSDQNRIRQILINLIGNAAKFTSHGKITISIKTQPNNFLEIAVKDTGIGISPDDQKKLFKAFGKLENGKEMNVQGVGLGLMISNVLAEKLSQDQTGQVLELSEPKGLKVFSLGQGFGTEFSFFVHNGLPLIRISQQMSYSSNRSDTHQSFLLMAQTYKISEMFSEKKIFHRLASIRSDAFFVKKNPIELEASIKCSGTDSQISSNKKKFSSVRTQTKFAQRNPDSESNLSFPDSAKSIEIERCDCNEVLIVDDQPFNILSLKTLLRKYQMRIDSTTDPLEAIEKVRNFKCIHQNLDFYKLIFMDLEMPIKDGYETAKEILKIQPKIFIIACSGHEGDEHKNHCLKMGMKDLITKPIQKDKLDSLIQKVQEFFLTQREKNPK